MRIDDLQNFVRTTGFTSFSQAAQELHISQQGLSQSVKRLEQRIGAALFRRDFKGIALTEFGEAFYGRAVAVLAEYQKLEKLISENRAQSLLSISVGLRISSGGSPISSAISCTVTDYAHRNTSVCLDMVEGSQEELLKQLKAKELDVVYAIPPLDEEAFEIFTVFSQELYITTSEAAGIADGGRFPIAYMDKKPIIVPEGSNPLSRRIDQIYAENRISPTIVSRERSAKTLVYMAHKGYGSAFVPRFSADAAARLYDNIRVYPLDPPVSLDYVLAVRRGEKRSPHLNAFIHYVMENAENNLLVGASL